jgi:hypothetical protein
MFKKITSKIAFQKEVKNQFISKLQDKIKDKNLSKEKLAEKLQLELDNENSKDKRKISKVKSENMALNLIKKFHINIDESQVKNYVKLINLVRNEELLDNKIDDYFKDEKKNCYSFR